MLQYMRRTMGPLFLILCCPPSAILMWYTNTHLDGSLSALYNLIVTQGFFTTLYHIWQPVFWGSSTAWMMIFTFILFETFLMKVLPGAPYQGPLTPKGNVPVYKANGIAAFIVTMATFYIASFQLHLFSASLIYDELGYLLGALNVFSLLFCLFLYIKGRFFPSYSDSGCTGNFIFDYYWGTELYPVVFGCNLKQLVNCRLGMMSWGVILLSYAAKQQALYGLSNSLFISILLQFIYITKFYIWETGYLSSLDVMHDRSGFYICWGLLVWVPCIYTSPSMYLVLHPIQLSASLAFFIFAAGTSCILINFFADRQRQLVRLTGGACRVWGKSPVITHANYTTLHGEKKSSLLLASGWWGIARHFHYVPEILAAFFWSLPALFYNFAPYFYVTYLTILLVDRAYRDDKRCAQKYGKDWQAYCQQVPYKIIPYFI